MGSATPKIRWLLAIVVGLVLSLTCQGHQIRGHHVGPHVSLLDPPAVAGKPQADSASTSALKEARKAANRWIDLTPEDRRTWHDGHYPGMKHDAELVEFPVPANAITGAALEGSGPTRLDTAANGNPPTESSGLATLSLTMLALLATQARGRGRNTLLLYEQNGPQTTPAPEPPPPR
jgi:hypothetical protein